MDEINKINWSILISHSLGWGFVLLFCNAFTWVWGNFSSQSNTILVSSLYGTLFNAIIFYAHILWLHPLKSKRKIGDQYYMYLILLVVIVNLLEGIVDYYYALRMDLLETYAPTKEEGKLMQAVGFSMGSFFFNSIFNTSYLIVSFIYIQWKENRDGEEAMETLKVEKTKAELRYLKSQVNPHFLFNGINSVYHLIDRNKELAKDTLMKFSGLLRYQLYECNEDKILLSKEVDYVEDYLAMEKVRRGEEVTIEVELEVNDQRLQIAPLLLTPFLENAFKYLSTYTDNSKNQIYFKLYNEEKQLFFQIENTYEEKAIKMKEKNDGGIGLENVRKRLKLLYPCKHDLSVVKGKGNFIVVLKIDLS